jgi:cation diffusion facilitator family transporter
MEPDHRNHQYNSVRRVLWGVLIANIVITVVKIALGFVTGALAVVADGFHSLVDSSSNLIGLAAIRLAARPADDRHPYGYQKYETLGALGIGGLLLVAAWEIVKTVIDRIIHGAEPEITWITLGLVILTFPVNLGVVILETRAGQRLKSDILLADATHTRTDLYVTASVIASLVGVWLGLAWLDLLVAFGVVILIVRAAFGIMRGAAGSLADIVGIDPQKVEEIALKVPGVRAVHNTRSRGASDAVFMDLHVKVDPVMNTSQAHAVASEVERRICAAFPNVVDAVVHIEPARFEESSDWEQISYGLRQIADGMGLGLHDLHVRVSQENEYTIEVDLEIGGEVTLGKGHQLADEFEARALNFWPRATRVHTHLEPMSENLIYTSDVLDDELTDKVKTLLEMHTSVERVLDVQATAIEGHKSVTVQLTMPPTITLTESHAKVEQIKRMLYVQFPEIERLVVHVEPSEN